MNNELASLLSSLGRVVRLEQVAYRHAPFMYEAEILLHQATGIREYNGEDTASVDFVVVSKNLWALGLPVEFLNRPKAVWTGRGIHRRKRVGKIEILVTDTRDEDGIKEFCRRAVNGYGFDTRKV